MWGKVALLFLMIGSSISAQLPSVVIKSLVSSSCINLECEGKYVLGLSEECEDRKENFLWTLDSTLNTIQSKCKGMNLALGFLKSKIEGVPFGKKLAPHQQWITEYFENEEQLTMFKIKSKTDPEKCITQKELKDYFILEKCSGDNINQIFYIEDDGYKAGDGGVLVPS